MKKHVRWITYCLAYVSLAISAAGCMNYLKEEAGKPKLRQQSHPSGNASDSTGYTATPNSNQAAQEFNLSGTWVCDSQCNAGIVKTISDKQDSIVTTSDVTDAKSLSVCRIQETAELAMADVPADDDNFYYDITPKSVQLVDAADNSGNCDDIIKSAAPGEKQSGVLVLELPREDKVVIDGVKFRRATAQDLQTLAAAHAKSMAQHVFDGDWACVDADHLGDELVISRSGKSITSFVNMVMDTKETCLVRQDMKITNETVDSAHPEAIVEAVTPGPISPGVTDTDTCDSAINEWNQKNTGNDLIKLALDGTQMLVVHGKHYVRKQ